VSHMCRPVCRTPSCRIPPPVAPQAALVVGGVARQRLRHVRGGRRLRSVALRLPRRSGGGGEAAHTAPPGHAGSSFGQEPGSCEVDGTVAQVRGHREKRQLYRHLTVQPLPPPPARSLTSLHGGSASWHQTTPGKNSSSGATQTTPLASARCVHHPFPSICCPVATRRCTIARCDYATPLPSSHAQAAISPRGQGRPARAGRGVDAV